MNDLKSNGFLDNLSYESNERTGEGGTKIIKLFVLIMQEIYCLQIMTLHSIEYFINFQVKWINQINIFVPIIKTKKYTS